MLMFSCADATVYFLSPRADHAAFRGVVSLGVAGGLDPGLSPGDILAESAVFSNGRWDCTRNDLSTAPITRFEERRREINTVLYSEAGCDHPMG